eukprot:IDg11215t1
MALLEHEFYQIFTLELHLRLGGVDLVLHLVVYDLASIGGLNDTTE